MKHYYMISPYTQLKTAYYKFFDYNIIMQNISMLLL
jgi:hypothetical protein